MSRVPSVAVAAFMALAPPAAAAKVALVVPADRSSVAEARRATRRVSVLAFDRLELADPIAKGRFLAALQAADRVVVAGGDGACGWLNREVEGVPVHCVAPYDGAQVSAFARSAGWRRVAVVYMAGYEKVFGRLRALARKSGVELVPVLIERPRDLPRVLPHALQTCQAAWILGDPSLTNGAAFDYLVKTTLAKRVPLIAPGSELVARGAFLAAETDRAEVLRHAVKLANEAAAGSVPDDSPAEALGGRLVFNKILARRWGVAVPGGDR